MDKNGYYLYCNQITNYFINILKTKQNKKKLWLFSLEKRDVKFGLPHLGIYWSIGYSAAALYTVNTYPEVK